MGLFGSKSEGGFMDVIRCDEPEYLVCATPALTLPDKVTVD